MTRALLRLIVGAVMPIVAPDVSLAQADFAIDEIRLLARPFVSPWSTRPPPAAVDLPGVWSAMDFQDSIVVEIEFRLPASELERAVLVADVKVAVARAVGRAEEEELLDWDRMYDNEVWLPSFRSFAVPAAKGEQVSNGHYVITLGHFMIEPIRGELHRHDRRLIVTHLCVTAALIAERAEDYSAEQFVERTIKVGLN
jgi:hypothetical protein